MNASFDVIVVGGGVTGAAGTSAAEQAERPRMARSMVRIPVMAAYLPYQIYFRY